MSISCTCCNVGESKPHRKADGGLARHMQLSSCANPPWNVGSSFCFFDMGTTQSCIPSFVLPFRQCMAMQDTVTMQGMSERPHCHMALQIRLLLHCRLSWKEVHLSATKQAANSRR